MHFTVILGTSAWADVYVTQVCFYTVTNEHICEHTRCRLCTHVYMYICVYMHACAYGCVCVSIIQLDTLRRCCWDFLSVQTCAYACVCICVCMYACICACVLYVYVYMYVCVYVCIYIYIRARVGVHMHSCRRVLFICTVQSLNYMRVYYRCFLILACVCVGGLEVGFVSACSWLVLVTCVGGYVLAGVEIRVLSCTFFYFCGC